MGDYLKNGVKIGTCREAYYSTRKGLEFYKKDPEAAYYLDPKNSCSFAFPFPEYDGKKCGEISNFHDGERADYFFKLPKGSGLHGEFVHPIHPKGAEGINIWVPCPYRAESKKSRMIDPETETFRLIGEKYENGEIRVLVECVYCEKKQLLESFEIQFAIESFEKQAESQMKEYNYLNYVHPNCDNSSYLRKAENLKEVAKRLQAYILKSETV